MHLVSVSASCPVRVIIAFIVRSLISWRGRFGDHLCVDCAHLPCILSSSNFPACAPQTCDRFVKYFTEERGNRKRRGSGEMAQITHGKVKRGGSSLMMLILPEREREKVNHREEDFALSHLKGLKGKGREGEARNRWCCLLCLFPIPGDAFKLTEIGTSL